jgi:hypothetical protein
LRESNLPTGNQEINHGSEVHAVEKNSKTTVKENEGKTPQQSEPVEETPIAHVSLDGNDSDYLSENDENLNVTP